MRTKREKEIDLVREKMSKCVSNHTFDDHVSLSEKHHYEKSVLKCQQKLEEIARELYQIDNQISQTYPWWNDFGYMTDDRVEDRDNMLKEATKLLKKYAKVEENLEYIEESHFETWQMRQVER